MFVGLINVRLLTLQENAIQHIDENTFAEILSAQRTTNIDLTNNIISELRWTILVHLQM